MKQCVLAIVNHKGGVAKTTTSVHLASALAMRAKKVLLIDMDPQSHVAAHLGIDSHDIKVPIEDALGDRELDLRPCIVQRSECLHVVPSSRGLFDARSRLLTRRGSDTLLARALLPVQRQTAYDAIIIDTPPDESVLSVNAMFASTHLLIPTTLKIGSIDGINRVITNIADLRDAHSKSWSILGVCVAQMDLSTRIENGVQMDALESAFAHAQMLFSTRIRQDETLPRSWREGVTAFEFSPRSKAAEDYASLASEVLRKLKSTKPTQTEIRMQA